jgi:hypothetical protein
MNSIQNIIQKQISSSIKSIPAGTVYSFPDDAEKIMQEIMKGFAAMTIKAAPKPRAKKADSSASVVSEEPEAAPKVKAAAPKAATPATPGDDDAEYGSGGGSVDTGDSKKPRKRTVSKKMKDSFLEAGTEEQLKTVIKAYKDASDADIAAAGGSFEAFAAQTLAGGPPKTKAAPKPRAAKPKGRLAWTAAEKKVFAQVAETAGATVNDDLKKEFEAYVTAKSDEDFKAFAMAGHMRAWADSKKTPVIVKAGNGEVTPAEHAAKVAAPSEDEDLEEIEIDGAQFLIGIDSGTIFESTEEAGDVKIGVAGEGKYKAVVKNSKGEWVCEAPEVDSE